MEYIYIFFELYAFIIFFFEQHVVFLNCMLLLYRVLTSTLVLGINYFVIITRPLHPIPVRKRSSSSCYDRNI